MWEKLYYILVNIHANLTKVILEIISNVTRKRYDLQFYHKLGRSLNLIKEINGIKYDAHYKTPWMRAERLFTKEPDTINWIKDLMIEDDIFYDIGANIGTYSVFAASRGVKVFAFEPEAGSYAILNKNIKINSFDKSIRALNLALNDKNIISELNISDFQPGKSNHSFQNPIDQNGKIYNPEFKQSCIGYRLDCLIRDFDLPLPNHVKIDVDGNEQKVIDGFGEIFNDKRLKSLMVEVNIENEAQYNLTELILSYGFEQIDADEYVNKLYLEHGFSNLFFKRKNK